MESTNRLTKTLLGAGLAVALGFALALSGQALAQGGIWETKASMPNIKGGGFAGVIDGKFHAGGGGGLAVGDARNNEHYVYDPGMDTWTLRKPIPDAFLGPSAVIDSNIYVVGGCLNSDCRINTTNLLESYDPGMDSWSTLASMPTNRVGHAVAALDGKLFVVGGVHACLPCLPQLQTFEIYDPVSNTWEDTTSKTPMPTGRENAQAIAIDGKLYVVGGLVRDPGNAFIFSVTDLLEVYDPATNSWATKAPMPTPRENTSLGVIGGKLHVVGGAQIGVALNTHEVYDPATNTWSTLEPMPTARTNAMASVIDDRLYVAGGDNLSGALNILEVFTPGPDVEVAPTEFDFADVPTFTSEHTVVTIQNVGAVSHTVTGISIVGDPSFSESSTATPVVLTPGATEDVTVTYLPTSIGLKLATLTVTSDEGTVDVSFLGNGLEGMVEDQATVLETNVNDAIIAFTLVGSGSGKSANGRLGAFANMIEAAGDLIEAGFIEDACDQLKSALKRVDGEPRPPDFVSGTDAEFIEAEIIFLRNSLGCS